MEGACRGAASRARVVSWADAASQGGEAVKHHPPPPAGERTAGSTEMPMPFSEMNTAKSSLVPIPITSCRALMPCAALVIGGRAASARLSQACCAGR